MIDEKFIIKIFDTIIDNFDQFKNLDIKLCLQIISRDIPVFNVEYRISNKDKINNISINVINDIETFKIKFPNRYKELYDTNSEFLDSIDIEQTEEIMIICAILHEFGHIDQIIKFINNTRPIKFKYFEENVLSCLKLIFGQKFYSDIVYHNFRPDELYAEMFKFKYFNKIYKLLKL